MRLTIAFLGLDLFAIEVSADSTAPPPNERGDCTSYPIGFTATFERPDEADIPTREA